MSLNGKVVFAAIGAVVLIGGVGGGILVGRSMTGPLPFEPEKWQTETCCRTRMEKSLLQDQQLIGKTKKEISNLLGPSETSPQPEKYQMWYSIEDAGKPRALGLTIADDKVTSFAVEPTK